MSNKVLLENIKNSIAYCGLVCAFCSEYKCISCEGCTDKNSACRECSKENSVCAGCRAKNGGCSTKECCISRNIQGCWECEAFPCGGDMQRSHRTRAFLRCAKEDGIERLAMYLLRNAESGIQYHRADGNRGDYDVLENEGQVLRFLRTGKV